MKIKKLAIIACLFVLAAGACVYTYILSDRAFATIPPLTQRPSAAICGTIKILIVGGSWAAGLTDPLRQALSQYTVRSISYPGKKSGEIYKAVQNESIESPHIAIFIAGVNDTALYIGSDYYSHHMHCLEIWAHNLGAIPVILQVPRYGINESFSESSLHGKARKFLYKMLFNNGFDSIEHYRKILKALNDTILINPDIVLNYPSVLFANPSHLNEQGNRALAELIAQTITPHLR